MYLGGHGGFDKRFMYEESFRTPLLVKWPGVTKPGSVSSDLVMNLDFAETLLEMTGNKVPSGMQGKSFVPVLKGKQAKGFRDAVYYHFYENQEHNVAKHIGVRTDRYKLIYFYEKEEWEMYDLQRDPHEMKNIYGDAAYSQQQQTLIGKLKALKEQYKDPMPLAIHVK